MIPAPYRKIIETHGAPGFRPEELVSPGYANRALPAPKFYNRIIEPLIVANLLRNRMIARGARGLNVHAAYRATGGAARSAHKVNEALDLDLLPADVKLFRGRGENLREIYAEESVILWMEYGAQYNIGLGHYGARGSLATFRCHIDTTGCRSWQHAGRSIVKPSSVMVIALRLIADGKFRCLPNHHTGRCAAEAEDDET
jgi:hypothetical protein